MRALPPDDAADLDHLLFRQSDVLSTGQALRHFSKAAIRHRLKIGRWQQPVKGVYLVRPDDSPEQRRWVAVLGGPRGAITGGRTALAQLGLRGFDVWAVHLLIPHTSRARTAVTGVFDHRTRHLPAAQVHDLGSPPCAMPARALVDAAQWARSDNEARTIIAAAFQQRLLRADDVRAILTEQRVRRRVVIEATVADAASGAHSLPEMEFLTLCRRAKLPIPKLQHRRLDSQGRQRYLDALFEEFRIHVEIDGRQHMDVRSWWADMQRQNDLWVNGERVLRFPSWAIRNRPDEVIATVVAALRAAGWQG